jgi:NAD+ kinase
MRAAVVYKDGELLQKVLKVLEELGVEVEVFEEPKNELEDFDFIVSIGGDGTILSLLQKLRKCPPIFGINTGRIGLLTHSEPTNFPEELKFSVERFEVETFTRLSCIYGGEEILALNEIAVMSSSPAKLTTISVSVDGIELDRLRCDGMIVATQIGSTGYAFSAGGPVVDPYLDSFIVIPIAPFRFGWKPWILRSDRILEIQAENALLIADGQIEKNISGKVTIRKSNHPAVFFRKRGRFSELARKVKRIE